METQLQDYDYRKFMIFSVTELDQIDFTPIKNYLLMEKEKKASLTKEEKEAIKKKQDEIDELIEALKNYANERGNKEV